MRQPKTWGINFTGLRAIAFFLAATGIALVVVVVSALSGVGSVWGVAEGMSDLLELFALALSLMFAFQQPSLFPATQSFWSESAERTIRTGTGALIEILAASLAIPAYLGLVLFIENSNVAGTTVGIFLFGIEPSPWFNGPVSLFMLCVAVCLYLVSVIVR